MYFMFQIGCVIKKNGSDITFEPGYSISYNIAFAPNEDSDQPAHPRSLIRVIAEHYVGRQVSESSLDGQCVFSWRICSIAGNDVIRHTCK